MPTTLTLVRLKPGHDTAAAIATTGLTGARLYRFGVKKRFLIPRAALIELAQKMETMDQKLQRAEEGLKKWKNMYDKQDLICRKIFDESPDDRPPSSTSYLALFPEKMTAVRARAVQGGAPSLGRRSR